MSTRSRPFYVRLLRLHTVGPGPIASFLMFEGTLAIGLLLALADLVSWWAVGVLPLAVAGVVKLNDIVAGTLRPETSHKGMRRKGSRPVPPGGSGRSRPRPAAAVGRARPAVPPPPVRPSHPPMGSAPGSRADWPGAGDVPGPSHSGLYPSRAAFNDPSPIGFEPPDRGPVYRATASVGGAVPWPPIEEVDAPVSPGMPLIRRGDWPIPRDGADLPERRSRGNQGRFER